jgi:hypothetical protein
MNAIPVGSGQGLFGAVADIPGVLRYFDAGRYGSVARRAICCVTFASAPLLPPAPALAQERIDRQFQPSIARPEYLAGQGPLVLVDRAHDNFHAGEEQFEQLARLLRADGYRVRGLEERVSATALAQADVLVVVKPRGNGVEPADLAGVPD